MFKRLVIIVALFAAASLVSLTGCEKALFKPQETRTQYDRYQILRGRQRSMSRINEFGGDEPALSERLRPLETP